MSWFHETVSSFSRASSCSSSPSAAAVVAVVAVVVVAADAVVAAANDNVVVDTMMRWRLMPDYFGYDYYYPSSSPHAPTKWW